MKVYRLECCEMLPLLTRQSILLFSIYPKYSALWSSMGKTWTVIKNAEVIRFVYGQFEESVLLRDKIHVCPTLKVAFINLCANWKNIFPSLHIVKKNIFNVWTVLLLHNVRSSISTVEFVSAQLYSTYFSHKGHIVCYQVTYFEIGGLRWTVKEAKRRFS